MRIAGALAVVTLAAFAVAESEKEKDFPLYDYPPYEGVCETYSHKLASFDPKYAEHVQLNAVAVNAPDKPDPITAFYEVNSTTIPKKHRAKVVIRGESKKNAAKKQELIIQTETKVEKEVFSKFTNVMKKCMAQEVSFADVYVASTLLKACQEGSYMADRKSLAFNCGDVCWRKYPQCPTFKSCITGCVQELKLAKATENDDTNHQGLLRPDGSYNIGREPGWTEPKDIPMIPSVLKNEQKNHFWPSQ